MMTRQEYEECGKVLANGISDGSERAKKHYRNIGKDDFISRTAFLVMLNDEMNRLEETKRQLEQQNINPQGIVLQQAECYYIMEIVKGMSGVKTDIENIIQKLEYNYNIIQSGEDFNIVYGSRTPVFQKDYDTTVKLKSVIDLLKGWLNNEWTSE